jgi:hypothetical protein
MAVTWLDDVQRAALVVRRDGFKAVTHGGVAHMDVTLAVALLHSHRLQKTPGGDLCHGLPCSC